MRRFSTFLPVICGLLLNSIAFGNSAVPLEFAEAGPSGKIKVDGRDTTLVPKIQDHLEKFLASKGNQIAAVVLVEVKSGKILAMAQGKSPKTWGSEVNTCLLYTSPSPRDRTRSRMPSSA